MKLQIIDKDTGKECLPTNAENVFFVDTNGKVFEYGFNWLTIAGSVAEERSDLTFKVIND